MFLYNLTMYFLQGLFLFASFFHKKARASVKGRKGWYGHLRKDLSSIHRTNPLVWMHCASLGEFEQGKPLLEKIKSEASEVYVLVTFFSPSGYEQRKNTPLADWVYYLPLDTPSNAKRFVELVKPSVVYYIKYEFWINYLRRLKRNQAKIYLVSGVFRETHKKGVTRYIMRKVLPTFTYLFLQNDTSQKVLNEMNYHNTLVTGDTRFDRVAETAQNVSHIPLIETFVCEKKIVIAGSTWDKDEVLIAEYIERHQGDHLAFIIAPHEIDKRHISQLCAKINEPFFLWSEIEHQSIEEMRENRPRVLIIDTIGLLSRIYQYGHVAYIGGAFGSGLHNILEAVTFGLPVIFGPHYQKFQEAYEVIALSSGHSISHYHELEKCVNNYLDSSEELQRAKTVNKGYVQKNLGATQEIFEKTWHGEMVNNK